MRASGPTRSLAAHYLSTLDRVRCWRQHSACAARISALCCAPASSPRPTGGHRGPGPVGAFRCATGWERRHRHNMAQLQQLLTCTQSYQCVGRRAEPSSQMRGILWHWRQCVAAPGGSKHGCVLAIGTGALSQQPRERRDAFPRPGGLNAAQIDPKSCCESAKILCKLC
jgi:hypothetical protein